MIFSVVIPTFNRGHIIEKTIKSLLNQSFKDFELIVVDDGSTDNTEEVIKSIDDIRLNYIKKDNAERAAARNCGANHAVGDYINYFDSDDLAYPNHLEVAFDFIKSNKKAEAFHLSFDIKNTKGKTIRNPTPISNINKQLVEGNVLSCNGVFLQKSIALKNPFNEDRSLSASEDYLLWLSIASQYEFYNIKIITSTIVEHDERSVLCVEPTSLIKRKMLFLSYIKADVKISRYYGNSISKLESSTYSYLALHLMMSGNRKTGLKYLGRSLSSNPFYVFSKRFLVTIKFLITV